jgi:hypothetical protein
MKLHPEAFASSNVGKKPAVRAKLETIGGQFADFPFVEKGRL